MNHADIKQTMKYAKLQDETNKKVLEYHMTLHRDQELFKELIDATALIQFN